MSKVRQDNRVINHSLFHNLGILNIKYNYQLEIARFMHRFRDNKLSLLFKGYFVPLESAVVIQGPTTITATFYPDFQVMPPKTHDIQKE